MHGPRGGAAFGCDSGASEAVKLLGELFERQVEYDDAIRASLTNKQIVQVTADGKYTVDAKWHACDATAFISVVRSPVTKSDILPYYSICTEPPANESVILTPGDFVTFSLINLNTNETVPELQPGTYELQQAASYAGSGINGFGCATNDTFQVEVKCIPTLYAPNAFHPGSSIEKNQTFSIDGLYLDDNFQVIIYNRWGEIVYESRDKNFKWDGTSRDGKLLPNDTYAYVIHYHSITDSSSLPFRVKRGGVLILR